MINREFYRCVLLLGTNMGDRMEFLSDARDEIEEEIGDIDKKSSIYESEPWGVLEEQNNYLNQALVVDTFLSPEELINKTQKIEFELNRFKHKNNGPRNIDIDILFYTDEIRDTKKLTLPHPRLHLRKFTLVPLCEIVPELVHPLLNLKIEELLTTCKDTSTVKKSE